MAGSISLSMSQQFKLSGSSCIPLSGGKLYTLAAGETNTPQNAYQDYGLTIAHPNPIPLDEAGRIPAFYLADGFIKIRLVDSDGLTQIEQDNLLVVGPSSGDGGGGGGGVDPTTVFATGDVMWQPISGSRTGWVRDNGRTIGSATSGATERANADCEALFSYLYNKYDDTFCPVSTGRGDSAAADWAANKTITLLDFRGCAPGGLPDMGASDSGLFDDVPVVTGDATTAGAIIGESLHALSSAELPAHTHPTTVTDPGHTHTYSESATGGTQYQQGGFSPKSNFSTENTSSATTGITVAVGANTGGDGSHNNVQRTMLGTMYRKL